MILILLFIYRFISGVIAITLVSPLWITHCIITLILHLVNSITYHNLIETEVPQEVLASPIGNLNIFVLKILTAIVTPFIYFWENLKKLNTIKF